MEENEIIMSREQFSNLLELSNIEIAQDTQEEPNELISRALIALERKLNFFNYPLSFFTAEVTNVLIVDDTELSIFQLSTMLQKIGMNAYVARSKEEALAEFKKKNFDFLVLDLYLPDYKDGFELIKEANRIKNEEGKNFKILVISGTDNPQIIQEAYKFEIDEFISKAPQWHEKVLKFISNSSVKTTGEEYSRYYINDNICALTLYKVNSEKYVEKIIKEVNTNVLTGKPNIIFNMEHVKIFSDSFANLFSEVYKSIGAKEGVFVLVRPCEDVIKALEYVFLNDAIQIANSLEEAVEYIEANSFNFN